MEVLEHFDLAQYFDLICGASMDDSRTTKSEVIAFLLEQNRRIDNAIMVGDTAFDVTGAAAYGIPTIGVAWGYGEAADMKKAGANFAPGLRMAKLRFTYEQLSNQWARRNARPYQQSGSTAFDHSGNCCAAGGSESSAWIWPPLFKPIILVG